MSVEQKQDYTLDEPNKIYILGSQGVGKTTLFNLFFDKPFDESIKKSQTGIVKAKYIYNKKEFTFKDLTDDENYTCTKIMKNELEDVVLAIVMFSLDDKNSFEYAKTLINFINNNIINNKEIYILLLGNKVDLVSGHNRDSETLQYENYASTIENCTYFEISCKGGQSIKQVKKVVNEIEVPMEETEENDGKLTEEERKKKIEEVQNRKCIIW